MNAMLLSSRASRRRGDRGAILVVVLLVMMALLGMGMAGLYLTSGTIQMNANINMRNQALQVAEAGIQRAKAVLNRQALPGEDVQISGLLTGTRSPSGVPLGNLSLPDQLPTDPNDCAGGDTFRKGAVLRDEPGTVTGCSNTSAYFECALTPMTDPDASKPPRSLGNYTIFIRQDQAECRLGRFTCDLPDPSCPNSNGIVVIRSEGTASDKRTMVAIEVTMARNPNPAVTNTYLATVCPAGQAGCDDNASVQQGITVSGVLPTGTVTGVSTSTGTGTGTGTSTVTGTGTDTGTGTGTGTGNSGPTSTSTSTGTGTTTPTVSTTSTTTSTSTGTCQSLTCPVLAVMGVYAHDRRQPTSAFSQWLNDHSSNCVAQNLQVDSRTITDSMLAPYKVVIVLDVGHNLADYEALNLTTWPSDAFNSAWKKFSTTPTVRQFVAAEGEAVRKWVQNGGGILVTNGYDDSLYTKPNFNRLIQPLGLTYFSPSCGLTASCGSYFNQSEYGAGGGKWGGYVINSFNFASPYIVSGMTTWYVSGYWPISGYPLVGGSFGTSVTSPRTGASYYVWAGHTPGAAVSPTAAHNTAPPYKVGVAGSYYNGRVVVVADEWLTYDFSMASDKYKSSAFAFWNATLKWLGKCP